ncbi:MAG: enoyl-CoA hydratase [Rhizobiales bacterium 65-9]|nr:enoyl-CoA hydratase [Hyphomicrobiales bacterium]OJY36819.1 MAG: enoyl-CoA hydratase [Rhizobiales bacterium 65-9]
MSAASMTASSSASPILRRQDADAITTLTLDSPSNRNALSEAMLAAISAELGSIAADDSTRVVIIAAAGPVFCPGHDLKEMTAHRSDPDRGRAYFADIMGRCSAMMQAIVHLPQPVIAAVDGVATAAGCQLVASCDLAVAGAAARFCTPGVNIGLFCSTPMVALSRNLSRKHAMEMLLTGEMIDAETAARMGLVNRVAPLDAALSVAMDLARAVAAKPRATVKIGKEAFYRQIEKPLSEAYDYASTVMVDNMLHCDAEEGIGAFIEKRAPRWRDQ